MRVCEVKREADLILYLDEKVNRHCNQRYVVFTLPKKLI